MSATRSAVEGTQNVEVSQPIPCEKTPAEQLAIMEEYTRVHREHTEAGSPRAIREAACLDVLFPTMFRHIQQDDLIAGRLDFLPIGFGSVTSVGGVGHYCVFHKLRAFQETLADPDEKTRVDALYDYWVNQDTKALYCGQALDEDKLGGPKLGRFIDAAYPAMATARLSGMMLDYGTLLDLGVDGLAALIEQKRRDAPADADPAFFDGATSVMGTFGRVIERQVQLVEDGIATATGQHLDDLLMMREDLLAIRHEPPTTFHQALQLFWLWALCAGCINYGRLDVLLGTYLVNDLENGTLTHDEAYHILKSLWTLIENRRTTVNGRIIVGGRGRPGPETADEFCRLALEVCHDCRYVEPQFTLRLDSTTPENIMQAAYRCLAAGATYPTLYNDDVEVPAVMSAMRLPQQLAEQYVPFGCTEFVIAGKSVGTPNTLINVLKLLQMTLNEGVDPDDGLQKCQGLELPPCEEFETFDHLMAAYRAVLDHYLDLLVDAQALSYDVMNDQVSFLFTSVLMDDCLGRGRALLDGGVEILGGTNEVYGHVNAGDALEAIRELVYEEGRYSLRQLVDAADADFVGTFDGVDGETIRRDLWNCDKYGNDIARVDDLVNEVYCYTAAGSRDRGIERGLGYFLVVVSNNQTNTDWGHRTAASLDGRHAGVYLNPANNPQGGAARRGPTAMLASLAKIDSTLHAGSVQNVKFTRSLFNHHPEKVRALCDTYFKLGGCQLMVTCVDPGELEHAQRHPEDHPDLIVRVAGYSARFVDLPRDVQDEVISRALWG